MKLAPRWMHTCPVSRRVTALCRLNGTANWCNERNMEAAKRLMELTAQSCSGGGTWINTWFNLAELRPKFRLQVTSNRQQGAHAITRAGGQPGQWSQTSQYCSILIGSSASISSTLCQSISLQNLVPEPFQYLPGHCSKWARSGQQCYV